MSFRRLVPTSVARFAGVVAVAAIALPAAALAATGGGDGVLLRYGFRAGASYTMTVGLDLTMQTEILGLPPEAAGLAELAKDVRQQVALALAIETGAAAPDGTKPMTVRVADVRATVSMGGKVVQAQGLEERLEGAVVLEGKLSADGRSLALAPRPDSEIPDASREMIGFVLQALPTFPERALRPGDSFELPASFAMPGFAPASRIETTGSSVFTLREIAGGRARFEVRGDAAVAATGDPAQQLTMKAATQGTAEFDLAEGIFTTARSDLAVELGADVQLPAGGPAPPTDATPATPPPAPAKIQMRGSAKGPIEVGVVRRVEAAR